MTKNLEALVKKLWTKMERYGRPVYYEYIFLDKVLRWELEEMFKHGPHRTVCSSRTNHFPEDEERIRFGFITKTEYELEV